METQCNSVTINRIRSDSHFVYYKEVLVVVSSDNGLIVSCTSCIVAFQCQALKT